MDLIELALEREKRIQQSQDPNKELEVQPLSPPPLKLSTGSLLNLDPHNGIELRTGLTIPQLEEIEEIVDETMEPTGPGPRGPDKRARLIALLQWMDSGATFRQLSVSLRWSVSQLSRAIDYAIGGTEAALVQAFIPKKRGEISSKRKFYYYPDAIGAVDATVFQILKPSEDEESYYSGKHGIHCLKVQALVTPDGQCVHLSEAIPGKRHDRILFTQSRLASFLASRKEDVNGMNIETHPKILAYSGYQGVQLNEYPEIVIPFKHKPKTPLTPEQEEYNRKLSSDRLIVENYFGRLKAYFKILAQPYRGSINSLRAIIRIAFALTNFRIRSDPLRSDKGQNEVDEESEEEMRPRKRGKMRSASQAKK